MFGRLAHNRQTYARSIRADVFCRGDGLRWDGPQGVHLAGPSQRNLLSANPMEATWTSI